MRELRAAATGLFLLSLVSSTFLATLSLVQKMPMRHFPWF